MAASGMLAIVTGGSEKCCEKVFGSKNWLDCLHCLLANPLQSMQYRGICVVFNIICAGKALTEKLMETDVMEILMALSKLPPYDGREKIVEMAGKALLEAEKWGVIQKPEDDD
ncbi:hypothetical protein JTB14_028779 [Gonioctena quinquepunctata]|nr:hypothetical protein JTB14_028779 [Gonioctena quinquepunctata]